MEISQELRNLVGQTVSTLGHVIEHELGQKGFEIIESLRLEMTRLRGLEASKNFDRLKSQLGRLNSMSPNTQKDIAHSFTLMLELINSCENAYRSHRLSMRTQVPRLSGERPRAIIYVLTAHPTEARSPQNISIFHMIQNLLIEVLNRRDGQIEEELSPPEYKALRHYLEIAWHTSIVRSRKPTVKDEADHIYSLLFRDGVLFSLIDRGPDTVPFYVRSWVGGDKDGHPGVDEVTLLQSLSLSRKHLLRVFLNELADIGSTLDLFNPKDLHQQLALIKRLCYRLRVIKSSDARSICQLKTSLSEFKKLYLRSVGALHPKFQRLNQIFHAFPALVVPLELRESSDILVSKTNIRKNLSIYKMLNAVERISRGGDPRWYARGFIISMTSSVGHIKAAASLERAIFQSIPIPIIPLFEEAESLKRSDSIVKKMTVDPQLRKAILHQWDGLVEMMVGYSDSSKEAGVLASRIQISDALPRLERVCETAKTTPVFFHGSGGSIDRGGGSIEDQTAWWPKSALRMYKVTVQGEMVERSLATPSIAKRQIESIVESATGGLKRTPSYKKVHAVENFAQNISDKYRKRVNSQDFMKWIEFATPYSYLNFLKIGSRPTKRSSQLTVKGLRAIPWVLCWTQTRVLFPTWWGVGSAWKESSESEKSALKIAFTNDPVFTSFIKALGFTLAKVELMIWALYLEESGRPRQEIDAIKDEFRNEFDLTLTCFTEISGQKDLLWFRPWLGESITLRSPMIHPLNLLQIIAKNRNDLELLRVTVTGISSGMLTTG